MKIVLINKEPVELYKLLKFEGLADSGGEAKQAVASGQVTLNGSPELQKRKKIVAGDVIEFAGTRFSVQLEKP